MMDSPTGCCSPFHKFRHHIFDAYAIRLPDCTSFLIWTLGLSIAIFFTVRDFVPLLSEYQDNNVAIQVEIKLLEDQFQPPRITLTIPEEKIRDGEADDLRILARYLFKGNSTNGSEIDIQGKSLFEKLENVSWDVWNDPNFTQKPFNDLFSIHNDLSLAFFHKLMTRNFTDIFSEENSSWNEPVISSILNYFQWRSNTDYLLSIPQNMDSIRKYRLEPGHDFLTDIKDGDSKLDILFVQMLSGLCRKIQYIESDIFNEFRDPIPTDATCQTILLENKDSVILDWAGLWIPLPEQENPTRKEYRFIFTHKNASLPQKMANPIVLYASTGSLYSSVIDGDFFTYLHQAPVEQRHVRQVVTARYKVQMRARESRSDNFQCRNVSNVLSCFPECTKQWFIQKCQCIPFNTRKHFANDLHFPYCNYTSYTTCNITKLPEDIRQSCKATCAAACSYTSYTWQFGYDISECDPDTSEFILKVMPTYDTFSEFTWTTKNTPEQFFAQLCGVASFYLGFHGLSIFAALIFLIKWWKHFRQMRKDRPSDQDKGNSRAISSEKSSDISKRGKGRNVDQDEEWFVKMKEALRAEIEQEIRKQLRAERDKIF